MSAQQTAAIEAATSELVGALGVTSLAVKDQIQETITRHVGARVQSPSVAQPIDPRALKAAELKPCPFCGGNAFRDFVHDENHRDICCESCGQTFRMTDEQWNSRIIQSHFQPPSMADELAEALRDMMALHGWPKREEWMNVLAYEDAFKRTSWVSFLLARYAAQKGQS